ncbi:Hypothetical predicted protein [Marmota monax]|uniref:FERM domain-containing protein n=1 Tax=Marmota monax TaxID=9995 RepID=A0A5E4D218_MARMO|nr:Hypothetical predicted protein [Marmota monax]
MEGPTSSSRFELPCITQSLTTYHRYELQIRYLPEHFVESLKENRTTLLYFYQQLRNDYMQCFASKVSEGMALQLGCLELRRFFKDMPYNALDKKSNLELLE